MKYGELQKKNGHDLTIDPVAQVLSCHGENQNIFQEHFKVHRWTRMKVMWSTVEEENGDVVDLVDKFDCGEISCDIGD